MSTPSTPAMGQAAARPSSASLPARTRSPAVRPERPVPSPPAHGQPPPDRRAHPGGYARADLGPDPASAAQARRLTRDTLARWDMRHLTDDAETIASELAANAINAATRPRGTLPAIIFAIHHRPPELTIVVWDNGPGHPQHDAAGPDAETGRGLTIIDNLTGGNWGWWPTPKSGGKVVWARSPIASSTEARHIL
jgi:anti-sigma regulatory factor (Ser/Thr protein kinase)